MPLSWACGTGRSWRRWPIPPAGPGRSPSCGCRISSTTATQYVLRFQEKGGKSREIPVRHELEGDILAYLEAAGIGGEAKDRPLFRSTVRQDEATDRQCPDQQGDLRAGQAAAERCRAAVAAVAALASG